MFAVIRTGGKQYKVAKDDVIKVEKLEVEENDTVECEVIYAEGNKECTVKAQVISQERAKKVIVFKKKRRQNYRRKNGHRQKLTVLKIKEIKAA